MAFVVFCECAPLDDLLNKGEIKKTAEWGINDHSAMIEKFSSSDVFVDDLTGCQIQNLADYFVTLPSEVAMKLWTVVGSDANPADNCVKLHGATAANGTSVTEYLVSILQG